MSKDVYIICQNPYSGEMILPSFRNSCNRFSILFVLFDVEVIFFYPYAVNFKSLGWNGFFEVVMFVSFFLVGFVYNIKKGALKWED